MGGAPIIDVMDVEFWGRIERTRPEVVDPAEHAAAVREQLVAESLTATLNWAAKFHEAMESLNTWDLWGAAYYAFAGCSDDCFEYLRAWLIGQGRDIWRRASEDPEVLFVSLLDGSSEPEEKWDALRIYEGEHYLYAAGEAHQRLTGDWIPPVSPSPAGPRGTEWEEDQLPEIYPRLAAVLPDDWWVMDDEPGDGEPSDAVLGRIERGLTSLANGDHRSAILELDVLATDLQMWREVPEILRADVAYAVGITRLVEGRLDDAEEAILLVSDEIEDDDALRRAMAQIQLARGELDDAARYIDSGEQAHRLDRALASKLAWRSGDRDTAVERASREVEATIEALDHPWDVAGGVYQAGAVLVEAGEVGLATKALRRVGDLIEDAPSDLPLRLHLRILRAGVDRLSGDLDRSLAELDQLCEEATGPELAECLRERARTLRAAGRFEDSKADYARAEIAFSDVGERWEAAATSRESEALNDLR